MMKDNQKRKVILIGIDGFDPVIADELMARGELPHFSSIKQSGSFKPLETSNPAQSPVAWASIATGSNPGHHGLFDFISRDPSNYLPRLAILKPNKHNFLGKESSMFHPVLKGVPFWDITSKNNVSTSVIKWPVTFPPPSIEGNMLAGLGVPDVNGTLGRYTMYSTENRNNNDNDKKGNIIKLLPKDSVADSIIIGPNKSELPFTISVDTSKKCITLKINDNTHELSINEWSGWIPIEFKHTFGQKIYGIARFYLNSISPEINLYMSSIHIDPRNSVFPLSSPKEYASELAEKIGAYHTLGLPEETNGLVDELISHDAFLNLNDSIQNERENMFWSEFNKFDQGVLAFVFDTVDRIQHMFWTTRDKTHPLYNADLAERHALVIEAYYKRMDGIIGRVKKEIDDDTLLVIVSDHGFNSFRRAVHLNTWLANEGWLVTKDSGAVEPLFENVDWKKTRAYALGFSSIYLNIKGREKEGVVTSGIESEDIKKDIAKSLLAFKDSKTNELIMRNVYFGNEIYDGPYKNDAPDIVIGLKPGFRVSWQTAVGAGPKDIIEDNLKNWSGDHLIDPSFVPGILFMNHKTAVEKPHQNDIAPTILSYFNIPKPEYMTGKALL